MAESSQVWVQAANLEGDAVVEVRFEPAGQSDLGEGTSISSPHDRHRVHAISRPSHDLGELAALADADGVVSVPSQSLAARNEGQACRRWQQLARIPVELDRHGGILEVWGAGGSASRQGRDHSEG